MTEFFFIAHTVLLLLYGFTLYLVIREYNSRIEFLERMGEMDYEALRHKLAEEIGKTEPDNEQTLMPSRVPAEFLVTKMVVPLKDRIVIGVWDDYVGYCHKDTHTAEEAKESGWFVRNSANSKWVQAVDPPNYTIDLPPPLDAELKP